MTKKQLVTAICGKTRFSKKDTETFLNTFIDTVTEELRAGNAVVISGFGSFEARPRKEKTCINPQTKEIMAIPSTKAPAFRAGKTLKDRINK